MLLRNLGALALAASLALSACSSDAPEPKIAPEQSPSTSTAAASPSPEPGATRPEEAVRAWVEARNQALQDGDVAQVRALSSASCDTCDELIRPIDKVYDNGGHYETQGWKIAGAKVESQTPDRAKVNVGLSYAPGTTVPSAGADPVRYDEEKHIATFRLRNTGDGWLVDFISYLS